MSVPNSPARSGCARHLLIIVGLLALALGVFVWRNPEGVSRLLDNQRAMREGRDEARTLDTPETLLEWIAAHPDRASLVVVEGETTRIAYQSNVPHPLAGLPALWLVAEWAAQADAGTLDTARLAPHTLNRRRLPGVGGAPDTVPVPVGLLVHRAAGGDRIAESALLDVLGSKAVTARARRYGADPPIPFEGLLLAWQRGDTLGRDASVLARRLAADPSFREEVREDFEANGFALSLDAQRQAAAGSLPRGSAAGYARLLSDALGGTLENPSVSARFLDALAVSDTGFGSKGGGFPGHLALALWTRAEADAPSRAVVVILSDLPLAVFYHLTQTRLADGLALRLLSDEAFRDQAAQRLSPSRFSAPR